MIRAMWTYLYTIRLRAQLCWTSEPATIDLFPTLLTVELYRLPGRQDRRPGWGRGPRWGQGPGGGRRPGLGVEGPGGLGAPGGGERDVNNHICQGALTYESNLS